MNMNYRGLHTYEDEDGNELTRWVYGYPIVDETTGRAYILNGVVEANDEYICIEDWRDVDPKTIGQCTGFEDVDGEEIYEGDIIKVTCQSKDWRGNYFIGVEDELTGIMQYGWIEGTGKIYPPSWYLKTKNDEMYFCTLELVDEKGFEIIGNVYENPERSEDK